jgi:hypothetical protein
LLILLLLIFDILIGINRYPNDRGLTHQTDSIAKRSKF